ncbi:MAG: HepT-like ribonuclease domain-containing protein [Parabacteroides sp.]
MNQPITPVFVNYPEVPWKDLMGLRDIIVHQYHRE